MKKLKAILSIFLALIFIASLASCNTTPSENREVTTVDTGGEEVETGGDTLALKTMTFNLRYDTTSHALMGTKYRGEHLMEIIDKYQPDSIGFCEATNDWMNYLRKEMKSRGYSYEGVGRDAGEDSASLTGTGNEHTPVFYNAERFDLLASDTFWLSTTPDAAGSRTWDAACNRVCTYVVLSEKTTGRIYAHFATHLDHVSFESQYHSVRIIQSYIDGLYEKYGNIGVVLSGDFNATAYETSDSAYTPTTYNYTTSFMDDSLTLAGKTGVTGSTWSGYQSPTDWEKGLSSNNDKPAIDTTTSPIDYIFLSKGKFTVDYYTVVDDTFTFEYNNQTWHNHPVSDHYGLYVECELKDSTTPAGFDETKCIDITATVSSSADLPDCPANATDLVMTSKITSGLKGAVSALRIDGEYIVPSMRVGTNHMYWEITAAFEGAYEVSSVSFKTGPDKMPKWAECYVSSDNSNWKKVGSLITDDLASNTVYSWKLGAPIECKYAKIVFVNCSKSSKLDRFVVFGSKVDTGEIALTPVSGPKAGSDEGYEKMVDGDVSTKFYINTSKDSLSPLVYKAEGPVSISRYTMTSANDTASYPDRVPAGWTLYGSFNGENWSVLDDVDDPCMSADNFTAYEYECAVNGIYTYFMIEFKLGSTGKTQIAEFVIYS